MITLFLFSFNLPTDFTEIMRALGYPRLISVENFRTPNFLLVAECLFWMVKRYDPEIHVSEDIDTEDDRVNFLTSVAQALASKAKIRLNTKRLYSADGKAVKELLKIAQMLYSASRANVSADAGNEEFEGSAMPPQNNIKNARLLATEITERGARLHDLLGNEKQVRDERSKALRFLDAMTSNLNTSVENQYVEKSARELVDLKKQEIEMLKKECKELESDEKGLDAKIKRKQAELERHEKRLKSLQSVRPAFMDEYEKLEKDLQRHYEIYMERFRNLDYLENELDIYNKSEQEKLEENDRSLKRIQKKIRQDELDELRRDAALDRHVDDLHLGGSPAAERTGAGPGVGGGGGGKYGMGGPKVKGRMDGGSESESEDLRSSEEDITNGSGSQSEELSLEDESASGSEIIDDDDDSGGSL